MSTSSFEKTIVINKKEAADTLIKHLEKRSSTAAVQKSALKVASRDGLKKKASARK